MEGDPKREEDLNGSVETVAVSNERIRGLMYVIGLALKVYEAEHPDCKAPEQLVALFCVVEEIKEQHGIVRLGVVPDSSFPGKN